MRNAAILEQNHGSNGQDLPYEELFNLSVLGVTASLSRLEFQERVLENLGLLVPFEIDRACLEEAWDAVKT